MDPSRSLDGSTFFKLRPGEELPDVLRILPYPEVSQSESPPMQADLSGLPERFITYYESLQRASSLMTLSPIPDAPPMNKILEQFKETLGEKMVLVKLLLNIQRTHEENELLLRRYLSEEDVERLVFEQYPIKDTLSVDAKYFRAVCEHNLRSFSVSRLSSPYSA